MTIKSYHIWTWINKHINCFWKISSPKACESNKYPYFSNHNGNISALIIISILEQGEVNLFLFKHNNDQHETMKQY